MEDNTVRGPRGPRGPHGPHGPHGGMGMPGEKAKNSKAAFNNLHLYLKKHIPAIVISLIMGMAGSIISVIGPDKLSDIVNEISKGLFGPMDLDKIKSVCILMMVLYLLSWVFGYLQGFIMITVTQRVTKTLRKDISRKINRIPLRYFDKNSFGDVLSRVTNDVDTIGQTLSQSIGQLISSVTLFFGALIMMLITNVLMTVAAIASAIIGFIFMMTIMKKSQKHFVSQQM